MILAGPVKSDARLFPTLSRKLMNQRPASRKGWGTLGYSSDEKSQGRWATRPMTEFRETKRLIDKLTSPEPTSEGRSRLVRGARGETYYSDQYGHDYLLNEIFAPLKKKLAQ